MGRGIAFFKISIDLPTFQLIHIKEWEGQMHI